MCHAEAQRESDRVTDENRAANGRRSYSCARFAFGCVRGLLTAGLTHASRGSCLGATMMKEIFAAAHRFLSFIDATSLEEREREKASWCLRLNRPMRRGRFRGLVIKRHVTRARRPRGQSLRWTVRWGAASEARLRWQDQVFDKHVVVLGFNE